MARVLLVEDDELMRDTVLQMLELDGHRVTVAEDGEAGLALLRAGRKVDLVITDILMPQMDGVRMINEIRSFAPQLPVLAISGGRRAITSSFSLKTAVIMGATKQLPKPFTLPQLQAAVKELLQVNAD